MKAVCLRTAAAALGATEENQTLDSDFRSKDLEEQTANVTAIRQRARVPEPRSKFMRFKKM